LHQDCERSLSASVTNAMAEQATATDPVLDAANGPML
jgi:hypothetical protein